MKDNKKHKKAEYGILITGLIILLAVACIIALCAGQYSVSVPEVTKILASRFVNVTKTWSNTAEGVVFTLRLPRIIYTTPSAYYRGSVSWQCIILIRSCLSGSI